jgi:hypothetical protein
MEGQTMRETLETGIFGGETQDTQAAAAAEGAAGEALRPAGVQDGGREGAPQEGEAVVFESQEAFDRVLGKRIEQERRKWQREHGPALKVGKLAMARYEGLDAEEAEKRANEEYYEHLAKKLDISPQAAEYIATHQGQPGGQQTDTVLPARLSGERLEGLFEQEAKIREHMPDFDVVEFAGSSEMATALIALGYPLSDIVQQFSGETRLQKAREQAEREVVERIRARNSMPAPEGGFGQADMEQSIRMMTDEQIESIDRAVRSGKRVVL